MNMELELLDLNSHEPEEYEGKIVGCNGRAYVVGPSVGAGAERAAHKLINVQSLLCMHVIKLWHDQEGSEFAVRTHERAISVLRRDSELREAIPVSLYFQGHGGFFELQCFVGTDEEPTDAVSNYVREADRLMKSADYAKAIPLYQRAISSEPFHTIALHQLAACQAELEDYQEAYRTEGKVVEIEPNYILYRGAQIYFAFRSGDLEQAMNSFAEMKSLFPSVPDYDEWGVSIYRACGRPQEAEQLLAAGRLSPNEMKKVQEARNVLRAAKARLLPKDRPR
jgi:tetratricopeptide (TPR) repeat protein